MAFPADIEDIARVDWAQGHRWALKFEDTPATRPILPSVFKEWFPAIDVTEQLAVLESHTVEGGITAFKMPKSTTPKSVRVTFHDNVYQELQLWLKVWINNVILNDEQYLTPLVEMVKTLHIVKIDREGVEGEQSSYLVYPEGVLPFTGTATPDSPRYEMEFIIVGGG